MCEGFIFKSDGVYFNFAEVSKYFLSLDLVFTFGYICSTPFTKKNKVGLNLKMVWYNSGNAKKHF